MRIGLSSVAVAAFTGARYPSIVTASNDPQKEEHAADGYTSADIISKVTRDVDKSYKSSNIRNRFIDEDECNTFEIDSSNTAKKTVLEQTDVGILGCRSNKKCEPDETSTLGGRCIATKNETSSIGNKQPQKERPQKPVMAAFRNRRTRRTNKHKHQSPRFLQATLDGAGAGEAGEDEEFVCPTNCPQAFCDCAQDDGDAAKCATELHDVCQRELLEECVPNKWLTFYEQTYCPFSECLAVENKAYEECSCNYYKDYCTVYYKYEQSIDNCEVGVCCDGQPAGNKWTCLPGMEPTKSPTSYPSVSFLPTPVPTVSHSPTISFSPTSSGRPSASPTSSTAPTTSSAPTGSPTAPPSGQPSLSSGPTTTPTKSPTPFPTSPPTVSPTFSPSDMPSYPPSESPSNVPSTTTAPSTSAQPTDAPSISVAPTSTAVPTSVPSTTGMPSFPPSLLPTTTQPPSASPSTSPPTNNPTVSPTKAPTASPTNSPSSSPTTPNPTASPVTDIPTVSPSDGPTTKPVLEVEAPAEPVQGAPVPPAQSGGNRLIRESGMLVSLFVGVGGAFWLFA